MSEGGEVKALCLQGPGDVTLYVGTNEAILEGSMQSTFKMLVPVSVFNILVIEFANVIILSTNLPYQKAFHWIFFYLCCASCLK